MDCPFCTGYGERLAFEEALLLAIWDKDPLSPGHLLLVPRRHVEGWFDASAEEQAALSLATTRARTVIEQQYAPDAYNIGINSGAAAGQTVFHLHVHLIPRYQGDSPDPRGGLRRLLPDKAAYWDGDT